MEKSGESLRNKEKKSNPKILQKFSKIKKKLPPSVHTAHWLHK